MFTLIGLFQVRYEKLALSVAEMKDRKEMKLTFLSHKWEERPLTMFPLFNNNVEQFMEEVSFKLSIFSDFAMS